MRGLSSTEGFLEDQADVSGRFKFAGVVHKLVIGGEVGQQTSDPTVHSYSGVPGVILVTPDETDRFSGVIGTKSMVRFTAETAGAYAGDTLEFGRLFELEKVARIDHRFAARYTNAVPTRVSLDETDVEPSFRTAFVYKPGAVTARVYVMWGTSFDPSAEGLSLSATTADLAGAQPDRRGGRKVGGQPQAPGLRRNLPHGARTTTAERVARGSEPGDHCRNGAQSGSGEVLVQGNITPRWLVLAGYTYLDARIIASPNDDVDRPLQDAPHNSLRLFSVYEVTGRLSLGAVLTTHRAARPAPRRIPTASGRGGSRVIRRCRFWLAIGSGRTSGFSSMPTTC